VQTSAIAKIWLQMGTNLVLLCLLSFVTIIVLDGLVDYFLYIKDLKMDKHEVKQEHKEQEGHAETKSFRKELHKELLSAHEKNDIEQSSFVLANPTHIAIGIYFKPEVTLLPFVSLHAKGEKARAIIAYAEKHGTPVVRDILVARQMFKKARTYSFIPVDMVEPIYRILVWLNEIEMANLSLTAEEQAQPGGTS
jgi:type III secretion protein U